MKYGSIHCGLAKTKNGLPCTRPANHEGLCSNELCAKCGLAPKTQWSKSYCSSCWNKVKGYQLKTPVIKRAEACLWCGTSLYGRRDNVKYCNRTHARRALKDRQRGVSGDRAEKLRQRVCRICKGPIPAEKTLAATFCSEKCSKRADAMRGVDLFWNIIFQPVHCVDCDTYFETLKRGTKRCLVCRKKEKRNRHTHSRRCEKYGRPYEPVSTTRVFIRNGWTCQICGQPSPKELRGTQDPLAPELDHVVSLWRDSSPGHVLSNCQLAHRKCNLEKSVKEQHERRKESPSQTV